MSSDANACAPSNNASVKDPDLKDPTERCTRVGSTLVSFLHQGEESSQSL